MSPFYVILHFLDSYIIKLFDRSVDLAQFNTNTPLYPICRAWMRNNPSVREPAAYPSPTHSMEEEVRLCNLGGFVLNTNNSKYQVWLYMSALKSEVRVMLIFIQLCPSVEIEFTLLC